MRLTTRLAPMTRRAHSGILSADPSRSASPVSFRKTASRLGLRTSRLRNDAPASVRAFSIFRTSRACSTSDRDVPVVVLDRLEAHRADDLEGSFVGGLQREDQVIRVAFDELLGRAHRDDLSLGDYCDRVGKELRFLHVVRGEKYRLPLLLQAQQDLPHLTPCAGVEPGRRLVEEHDLGVVHERNRDSEALLQASGEVLELFLALSCEVHELYQPLDIGVPAGEQPRVVLDGLPDRYPVERAEPLRKDADAGDDVALPLRDVHPEKAHFSRRGRADGVDDLDGRGLAGAVRAQEREHLALPDRERYVVDRQQIAVALRQVLDVDGGLVLVSS